VTKRRAIGRASASREDAMSVSGRRAVVEAVRAGRARAVLVDAAARSSPAIREVERAARDAGVSVRDVPRAELDALVADHRGVVATIDVTKSGALSERELASFEFSVDAVAVVLDGVSDPQNVGAAARSAEAAGAAVFVTRVRRAAPITPAAIGASAGALWHLPHARVANIAKALHRLKEAGFTVVGLDAAAASSIYDEPCPPGRIALVIGSEGAGMARLVRETCDVLVRVPMLGRVASLNASASLAAALYGYVLPSRGAVAGLSAGGRPAEDEEGGRPVD
jgi:23S rRNA (guanosine2251-2'-O)-methyltransferase